MTQPHTHDLCDAGVVVQLFDTVGGYLKRLGQWLLNASHDMSTLLFEAHGDPADLVAAPDTPLAYPLMQEFQELNSKCRDAILALNPYANLPDRNIYSSQSSPARVRHYRYLAHRALMIHSGRDEADNVVATIPEDVARLLFEALRRTDDIYLQMADARMIHKRLPIPEENL